MDEPHTLAGPPLTEVQGIGALTLGALLTEQSERFAPREALVFDDPMLGGETVRWSYSELLANARAVANGLLAAGVSRGAHVGILMGNRPEAVAAIFGAALAGAVAVPLSTFSPKPELAYLLRHADLSALLVQSTMQRRDNARRDNAADVVALCPSAASGHPIMDPAYPHLRAVVGLGPNDTGIRSWNEFLAAGEDVTDGVLDSIASEVHPADPGVIIYSSGTTDRPKGVQLSQQAVALQYWLQATLFGRDPATRVWCPFPIFWTAGLCTAMGATLAGGSTWVMQEAFDAGPALALIERERVTEPHVFAHQARALSEHPDWLGADLSSCTRVFGKSVFTRHPTVAGDPTWNMPIGYGMSETSSFLTGLPSTTPREVLGNGSYGRVLAGSELRVIDPDTGRGLSAGEEGELIVRGPTLMDRYVKRSRAECLDPDGWYHTGDFGCVDDDGFVYFAGRRTEMIKTAGANVSPAEIETQLQAFAPIKLARAIGVPDEERDEIAVLCVELQQGMSATEDDIKAFLRERVASYKVPRRVLFFGEDEMPLNGSGTKVQNELLLAAVKERLT